MEPWLAYFHYVTIFVTLALLLGEFVLLRLDFTPASLKFLARLDIGYAVFAGLVIVTGLARVFGGDIPASHWGASGLFWTKMALFGVVGLLSVPPTMRYLTWNRTLAADGSLPDASARKKAALYVHLELAVMVVIPALAVFMGR